LQEAAKSKPPARCQEQNMGPRETVTVMEKEILTLVQQQTAAENKAARAGMTVEESKEYRDRHCRIRSLIDAVALARQEDFGHETQVDARQGAKGD
jgi:hypothetical protein